MKRRNLSRASTASNHDLHRVSFAVVASAILILFRAGTAFPANWDDWVSRFEKEAPLAWKQMHRDFYDLSFRRMSTTTRVATDVKVGNNCRLVHVHGPLGEAVHAFNSKYQFSISRTAQNEAWIVEEIVLQPAESYFYDPETLNLTSETQLVGILYDIAASLRDLNIYGLALGQLSSTGGCYWTDMDDFRVLSAFEESIGERKLLRLEASWKSWARSETNGNTLTTVPATGTFWCDPDCRWAVIKSEIRLAGATMLRVFDYEPGGFNGLPNIKHETFDWQPVNGSQRMHEEWTCECDFGKRFPEREFRLSAFGLPEPPGISWGQSQWFVWAAIFGLVLVAGGLLVRRRMRISEPIA